MDARATSSSRGRGRGGGGERGRGNRAGRTQGRGHLPTGRSQPFPGRHYQGTKTSGRYTPPARGRGNRKPFVPRNLPTINEQGEYSEFPYTLPDTQEPPYDSNPNPPPTQTQTQDPPKPKEDYPLQRETQREYVPPPPIQGKGYTFTPPGGGQDKSGEKGPRKPYGFLSAGQMLQQQQAAQELQAKPSFRPVRPVTYDQSQDYTPIKRTPQGTHFCEFLSDKSSSFEKAFMDEFTAIVKKPAHIIDNSIKPIPIHNLSEGEIRLDMDSHQTLAYGLKFAPQPRKLPSDKVIFQHFTEFQHNMMNRYSAHVEGWKNRKGNQFGLHLKMKTKVKFIVQPRWGVIMNFCEDVREDLLLNLNKLRNANPQSDEKGFSNMSKRETKALKKLKNAKSGILKPSDKNMGSSISTSAKYKKGAWQHLSDTRTYTELEAQEKVEFCTKAVEHLTNILAKYNPDEETSSFLKAFIDNFDIPSFYIIWKIHKLPKEVGRPIVASCQWITTQASKFVAAYLKEYMSHFDTILQDTSEVLRYLNETKVPALCTLFTLDAVSLYTNIPISGERNAVLAMRELLKRYPRKNPSQPWEQDFVIDLLDFVLHTNLMEFDKGTFLQIFGIAMGTNLAPILANIYLAIIEKEIKEDHKDDPKFKWPLYFKRFIDDILGIMDGSVEDVKYFIEIFNKYVPSIKVEPIKVGNEVDFMDLVIFKGSSFYYSAAGTAQKPSRKRATSMTIFPLHPWRSSASIMEAPLKELDLGNF